MATQPPVAKLYIDQCKGTALYQFLKPTLCIDPARQISSMPDKVVFTSPEWRKSDKDAEDKVLLPTYRYMASLLPTLGVSEDGLAKGTMSTFLKQQMMNAKGATLTIVDPDSPDGKAPTVGEFRGDCGNTDRLYSH